MSKIDPPFDNSKMKIQWMAVDAVIPYENNPRKIPKEAVEKVANSIREFGFKQPIVVDKDMVIIVGHTRLLAAKQLGYEKVPVLVASDLSPEKARAYRLADNKTNEFTDWEFDTLQEELASFLSVDDFNMEDFGFDMSFLGKSADDVEEDDFEPETEYEKARENCNVSRGERWMLENHVLMCGDSTSATDVRVLMDDNWADLCITDPPYNIAYNKSKIGEIKNDNMDSESFSLFISTAMQNIADSVKEGSAVYVFYADAEAVNFINAYKGAGLYLSTNLIWVKNNVVLSWADYQPKHEPCLYGWKEGATHYFVNDRDNSTVIASEQMGRCCRMMEYDPIFCQVIINRWEALTGKTAVKIC